MKHATFKYRHQTGFTIVELLIVIVVVGILATITIVAFNGIRQRAIIAVLQSDLRNGVNQLKSTQVTSGNYPGDTADVKASSGTTYRYTVDNTTNPQVFCLTGTNNGTSYYVDQAGTPQPGICPGQNITWVVASTLPTKYFNQVLMSGDGLKLVLTDPFTPTLYRSFDGGSSWSQGTTPVSGGDVRQPGLIVADGSKLLVSSFGNGSTSTYYSTNLGTSLNSSGFGRQITQFASSSNGSIIYGSEYYDFDNYGGGVLKSTDGGITASYIYTTGSPPSFAGIATSSDGTKVVAAPNGPATLIYSTNAGSTWTNLTASGARSWSDVVMSFDGTKMAAIGDGIIYTSADSGTSWIARPGPGTRSTLAMSTDGSKLISVNTANAQYVYTSNDSGVSWTPMSSLGAGRWLRPSISSDGLKYAVLNSTLSSNILSIGTYH